MRAQIAYDETTRRMRIAFSIPNDEGDRTEHWVGYSGAIYNDGLRKPIEHFEGPQVDARSAKSTSFSMETLIIELKTVDFKVLSDAAYVLWQKHFGSVEIKESTLAVNAKRRQRDRKRRRKLKNYSAARRSLSPSPERPDAVATLSDEELYQTFLDIKSYFPEDGYERMSLIILDSLNATEAPTIELLQGIRERAMAHSTGETQQIFADPEYESWYDRCVAAAQDDDAMATGDEEEGLSSLADVNDAQPDDALPFIQQYLSHREDYIALVRRVEDACVKYGPEEEDDLEEDL